MKKSNKNKVKEFIRVDHAGERGAIKIYEGQLLALNTLIKDENLKKTIEEMKVHEKEHCDFCLYTITPKMSGVYSIAEVVDGSNKKPYKNILCLLFRDGESEFTFGQWKSLKAVADIVKNNGGRVYYSIFTTCTEIMSYWEGMND